ncbi:MAG: hypothetical protein QOI59_1579 [Gammaproteobacteria bacterium]|jgi:hypothetical protein|nr:hypothetical protein [Gammaproteobacteria bacterium]
MNTDALTNTTVKAAIEALQKGDQHAWAALFLSAHGKIERLDIGQA